MININLNPFYSPVPSGGGLQPAEPAEPAEPAKPAEPATPSHGNRPLTRKEIIQAGGELTPLTREEVYLKKQMEQGGGGLPDMTDAPFSAVLTVKQKFGGGKEAAWSDFAMYRPSASDIGMILGVVSDGEGNPEYDVVELPIRIAGIDDGADIYTTPSAVAELLNDGSGTPTYINFFGTLIPVDFELENTIGGNALYCSSTGTLFRVYIQGNTDTNKWTINEYRATIQWTEA